MFNSYWVNPFF